MPSLPGGRFGAPGAPFGQYLATGTLPPRLGNAAPVTAPAGVFRTKDGHIVLSAASEKHWQILCQLVGRTEWITDPRFATAPDRDRHRAALSAALEESLVDRDSGDWLASFRAAGLAAGQVQDYRQLEASAQLRATEAFIAIADDDDRTLRAVRPPARLAYASSPSSGCRRALVSIPARSSAKIGYSEPEIETLLADGAVGEPAGLESD